MKINLIGMILNNCGRRAFDGAILDDNGKPMSAADSLHTMILEYAKVIHGGESSLVTTSREVTAPATQEHRRDHAFQGPPMTSELTKAAQQALDTAPAPAVPSGWSITDNGDNSITVTGPLKTRCTVSDDEPYGARIFGDVLHALCRAMLTAAPTPPAQTAVPESADASDGLLRVIASMGAALRRLSFAAQTSGGTAGPDAELMAAIGQAQQALSLGGIGAAMFACQATPAVPEDVARVNKQMLEALEEVLPALPTWHRPKVNAAINAARAAEKGGA